MAVFIGLAVAFAAQVDEAVAGEPQEGFGAVIELGKDGKFVMFRFGTDSSFPAAARGRVFPMVFEARAAIIMDAEGKRDEIVQDKVLILLGKRVSHPEVPERVTPDDVLLGTLQELKKGQFNARLIVVGPQTVPPGYDAAAAARSGDDMMFAKVLAAGERVEVAPVTDETKPYIANTAPNTRILMTTRLKATDLKPGQEAYVVGQFRRKDAQKEADLPGDTVFEARMLRVYDPRFRVFGRAYDEIMRLGVGM